jgi:hypothetical protein
MRVVCRAALHFRRVAHSTTVCACVVDAALLSCMCPACGGRRTVPLCAGAEWLVCKCGFKCVCMCVCVFVLPQTAQAPRVGCVVCVVLGDPVCLVQPHKCHVPVCVCVLCVATAYVCVCLCVGVYVSVVHAMLHACLSPFLSVCLPFTCVCRDLPFAGHHCVPRECLAACSLRPWLL